MRKAIRQFFTLSRSDSLPLRRLIPVIASLLFLSACAPMSPTAREDKALFHRLCDAPDRNFIKYALKVDGFAEGREITEFRYCPITGIPFKLLVNNSYKFYECFDTPWRSRHSQSLTIFRVKLFKKGHTQCEHTEIIDENLRAKHYVNDHPEMNFRCFGIEETKTFNSEFVLVRGGGVVDKSGEHLPGYPKDWPDRIGAISFSRNRILRIDTGEIIAERKTYTYFPSSPKLSDLTGVLQCKSGGWEITDVLLPPVQ